MLASRNQHYAKDSFPSGICPAIKFSHYDLWIPPFPFLEKQYISFSHLPVQLPLLTAPQTTASNSAMCKFSHVPGYHTSQPEDLTSSVSVTKISYAPGWFYIPLPPVAEATEQGGSEAHALGPGSLSRYMISDQLLSCFSLFTHLRIWGWKQGYYSIKWGKYMRRS